MDNPPFIHKLSDVINEHIPDGYGYILIVAPFSDGGGYPITSVSTFEQGSAIDLIKEIIEENDEMEEE